MGLSSSDDVVDGEQQNTLLRCKYRRGKGVVGIRHV